MEKVVIEEFNCCHSFVQSCINFLLPLEERKFICITHLVGGFISSFLTTKKISREKLISLLLIFYINFIIGYLNTGM